MQQRYCGMIREKPPRRSLRSLPAGPSACDHDPERSPRRLRHRPRRTGRAPLGNRVRSNEQPIDRRLNEAGAEVEVAGGVGLEADLQAACALACEPIEAVRQQHAGEAASLVCRPRRASVRGVRPASWGRTRTTRSRRRLPSASSTARSSVGSYSEHCRSRGSTSSPLRAIIGCGRSARVARSTIANPSTCATGGRWSASIHVVPDNSSVIANPLWMARSASGASSSRTSTSECLAPMSGGGFQRRGPDVFLVDDRRHGEDVCLPGVVPGRQPCRRHRADLVEPDRQRQLVGRPGAAPPPLHVGGLPHAARADQPGERAAGPWSSRSAARDPAAARVARPRSSSVLAGRSDWLRSSGQGGGAEGGEEHRRRSRSRTRPLRCLLRCDATRGRGDSRRMQRTGGKGGDTEIPGRGAVPGFSPEVVTVSRPVGGILSGASCGAWVAIHLRGLPGGALAGGRAAHAPCSALLRVGFAEPPGSPRTLVRSYRTVSPLPVAGRPAHRRSALCGTVRQVAPTWLSPAPCPVESRPSSTVDAGPRPPGRLTVSVPV